MPEDLSATGIVDLLETALELLILLVLFAKIYLLYFLGIVFHTGLMDDNPTSVIHGLDFYIWCLADIPICFVYYLILKLMWYGLQRLRKKLFQARV